MDDPQVPFLQISRLWAIVGSAASGFTDAASALIFQAGKSNLFCRILLILVENKQIDF